MDNKDRIIEDYKLIPMSDITDEARKLAVAWMECEDKNWIGQKHKLASDIMNYAKKYHESLEREKEEVITPSPIRRAITDEEIHTKAQKEHYDSGLIASGFEDGARWMRDKMSKYPN